MKTKTITALEQALADIGGNMEPRRADEFTSREMHDKMGKSVSFKAVQVRLKELVASGAYVTRRLGPDHLYRKVVTR
jgi:hypothetical protein